MEEIRDLLIHISGGCKYVFDESGRYLQCSMHTICYDPVTGEALSEICAGKKLTALHVREAGGWVYLVDKRAAMEG